MRTQALVDANILEIGLGWRNPSKREIRLKNCSPINWPPLIAV
jgi:hypothetical protein